VVSRLDPDKFSIPLFIKTMRRLIYTLPNLEIRIAGTGEISSEVRHATSEAGLLRNVRFLGFVDDISGLYEWADAVFVPSYTEAMPYTALESAAFGIPCIIPRVGYFEQLRPGLPHVHAFAPGSHEMAANYIMASLSSDSHYSARDFPAELASTNWTKIVEAAYDLTDKPVETNS
jgi:glycosyltransferase involved in cell wall biosynthesis